MADVQSRVDPYQPVLVDYGVSDSITGKQAKACVDWLREERSHLREDALGPARATETRRCVEFYEQVVRQYAWIRMNARSADKENPLAVRFNVSCSYEPDKYLWQFGDGDESPVAEPVYHFAKPGTYAVTVKLQGPDKRRDERTMQIQVPLRPASGGIASVN